MGYQEHPNRTKRVDPTDVQSQMERLLTKAESQQHQRLQCFRLTKIATDQRFPISTAKNPKERLELQWQLQVMPLGREQGRSQKQKQLRTKATNVALGRAKPGNLTNLWMRPGLRWHPQLVTSRNTDSRNFG